MHWLAARLVNERFLLGVVGVISDEARQILLFHHTYRRTPWGLPGGWMGRAESPFAALEREVLEESGLVVRADRLLLFGTTPDRPKLEFVVGARVIDGSFRPSSEVSAAQWAPLDRLPQLPAIQHAILADVARLGDSETGSYSTPWFARHDDDSATPRTHLAKR
jgi:ADP-ribose pyrophosphatase YjhB (NUDIX family)